MQAIHSRIRDLRIALAHRACRIVFTSQLISGLGDWAGRLALSVLVFERSDSAALTAVAVAVSLLPWLGPGQHLATLADRYGRIRVMVLSDLVRAAAFGAMAITSPIPLLLVLAFVAGLGIPPFEGAKSSAMVELTDEDTYPSAVAVHAMVNQIEVLLGYALGGFVIAAVGVRIALAVNAITFLVSATLIRRLRDTAAARPNEHADRGWRGVAAGVTPWRRDPICRRALLLFVGTSMFSVLPEALLVPFTAQVGVPDAYIGVVAACIAIGSIVGVLFAPSRGTPDELLRSTARRGIVAALAAGTALALSSSVPVAFAAYAVTGLVDAIAVPTNQVVGRRLPQTGRAAALTVAMGAHSVAHVLAISVAGLAADAAGARQTVAAGMGGAALVCLWAALRRLPPEDAGGPPGQDVGRSRSAPFPGPTSPWPAPTI